MPWLITFEDEPSKAHVRDTHTPMHSAYVRSLADLLCAGPLRQDQDGKPTGGLWILDTATQDEAMALFHEDPFFKEGLRRNVRVQHWTRGVWKNREG